MVNKQYVGLNMLFASGLALSLSACVDSADTVRSAAQQRWDALIQGELEKAYQFYTPAFQEATPLETFKRRTKVGLWRQAEVLSSECDTEQKQCAVKVKVTVAMKMRGIQKPVTSHTTLNEYWVNGSWFSDWRYIK